MNTIEGYVTAIRALPGYAEGIIPKEQAGILEAYVAAIKQAASIQGG